MRSSTRWPARSTAENRPGPHNVLETVNKRHILPALAVLVASCSGGGDATTTAPAADTTTTAPPGSTTVAAADATITIQGFAYGDPITVGTGEEVTVVNADSTAHTWTSMDGLFDSGSLTSGASFNHTFDEAGEYTFFCGIHPQMTGSITVES